MNDGRSVRLGAHLLDADGVAGLLAYHVADDTGECAVHKCAEVGVDALGQAGLRVETRHYLVRNRIPANTVWAFSVGVEIAATQTGAR